ncbi:hypothetical protein TNCT_111721 [Trichonephila clavata]|uniref:Uncharacterized protein n=1 Tax=Trichonephila clavata TaxID=2740835 RepID=A0A8X6H9Q3_TRICU|nr:hypothetical protein TNCT_111721 [Trichonephila clavata]
MDRNTENHQLPKPPLNDYSPEMLLKDPRLTTVYTDPCQKHMDMEQLLIKILEYRSFLHTAMKHVQESTKNGKPSTWMRTS